MPKCTLCEVPLPDEFFRPAGRPNPQKPAPLHSTCKFCRMAARSKKSRQTEKSQLPFYKDRVFEVYGRKCNCCGETEPEFLTIDHVNGNGAEEKRKFKTGIELYKHIIRQNYPNTYQVLCMNCNWAKGQSSQCPHLKKKEKDGSANK